MRHVPTLFASLLLASLTAASAARAGVGFAEARAFASWGGWAVVEGPAGRRASGLAMLGGAGGVANGVATKVVTIKDAGHYRIWVRYTSHPRWRGPFRVT